MKTAIAFAFLLLAICYAPVAYADTFGSSANSFNIDFVTIGNPGNAADTTGDPNPVGSVAYTYWMGKFEISEQMIDKANAEGGLGTTKDTRGPDKPATSTSWNEAARFVNWLNTSTGSAPAYKFALQPGEVGYYANADLQLWTLSDAGYNPHNLYRNSLARYSLPSEDEWYKAAYYDPTSGVYFSFPTGSNSAPVAVSSGTAAGTAVYDLGNFTGPADITLAGGLSPYGTMGQGGNVYEWLETEFDLVNDSGASARAARGGYWHDSAGLATSSRGGGGLGGPSFQNSAVGFRVAIIPDLTPATGDYNGDGVVDTGDYVVWKKSVGNVVTRWTNGDANGNGFVENAEYQPWRANYGRIAISTGRGAGLNSGASIPEPASLTLSVVGVMALLRRRALRSPSVRLRCSLDSFQTA